MSYSTSCFVRGWLRSISAIGAAAFAIGAVAIPQSAGSPACSERDAFAAETVTDYLDSWDNVYLFYKQFRRCYDGSIAEGASDKIQRLWSDHWPELKTMVTFCKKDPEFRSFILERITDEDFGNSRFQTVVQHAREDCPPDAGDFCRAVLDQAARAGRGH